MTPTCSQPPTFLQRHPIIDKQILSQTSRPLPPSHLSNPDNVEYKRQTSQSTNCILYTRYRSLRAHCGHSVQTIVHDALFLGRLNIATLCVVSLHNAWRMMTAVRNVRSSREYMYCLIEVACGMTRDGLSPSVLSGPCVVARPSRHGGHMARPIVACRQRSPAQASLV